LHGYFCYRRGFGLFTNAPQGKPLIGKNLLIDFVKYPAQGGQRHLIGRYQYVHEVIFGITQKQKGKRLKCSLAF